MAGPGVLNSEIKFSLLGVLVHFLYLLSVFEIYFKSPILQGLREIANTHSKAAPAKRLVLIITDGLQAEKAFHTKYETRTSFFRHILKNNGSWGVSHTRVPTETRVGHVSIAAGTFEDVSAITNGWKSNPVEFDSIINRSSRTWYWGEQGVIDIFKHHAQNVNAKTYQEYDFAGKETYKLDQWVFDNVAGFLRDAKQSPALVEQLNKDGTLFFIHLIGIDTVGHAMKPDSPESLLNVEVVNEGIRNITDAFESFFNHDSATSYIITSDHGMTPWGTHGAGLPCETETPFVAWGAGIKGPNRQRNVNKDLQSSVWGLEDYERRDLQQIDLTPLMAHLLGTSIPVNSLGRLPLDVLSASEEEKANGLLLNVRQIQEQYKAHERNVMKTSFIFHNFSHVEDFHDGEMLLQIRRLLDEKRYDEAIRESVSFITQARKGISYYQTYNRFYLRFVINAGFIGWMFLVAIKILKQHTSVLSSGMASSRFLHSPTFSKLYSGTCLAVCVLLYLRTQAITLTIFSTFPLVIFKFAINELNVVKLRSTLRFSSFAHSIVQVLLTVFGVELIVVAFFKRGTLSIIAVFLCALPWFKNLSSTTSKLSPKEFIVNITWTVLMLAISSFPLFPVVAREENYFTVVAAGFLGTTISLIYSFFVKNSNTSIMSLLTGFLLVSVIVKMHTVVNINSGNGLPVLNQMYSWVTLIVLPALVFLVESTSIVRVYAMSISLFSIYLLMAISYEGLFLLNLVLLLISWIFVEIQFAGDQKNPGEEGGSTRLLTIQDIHRSFVFVFFIFLSFFGTGNIASINSFDIPTTYCFQTIFNKTIQGVIIAIKVFIPFCVVTIFFRSLQSLIRTPIRGLFLVVLLMTDLMALNFFFLVADSGSWLDVGQSVSHFVITLVFIVVLVPIYELSYYVSGSVKFGDEKSHVH